MIICMVGLVWVIEWTSVLVIILRIPKNNTAHSKKNKQTNKQKTNKILEKQRGRAGQQKITVQSKLFHCINRSEHKLTIHLLDFSLHFPFNHEVRT